MSAWSKLVTMHRRLENHWLVYSWGVCVVVVGLVWSFSQFRMSTIFLGLTQSRTVEIKQAFPVKIKKLLVASGQKVEAGDPLLELDQQELALRIDAVTLQLAQLRAQSKLNEDLVREALRAEQPDVRTPSPSQYDLTRLDNELKALRAQYANLYVRAPFQGVIDTVTYGAGETVQSFVPILTISRAAPSSVQGFLEESAYTAAELDQEVRIISLTDPRKQINGTISSLGTRIIALPERLKPFEGMSVWGREVWINIPEENPFLVGEKVKITTNLAEGTFWNSAIAAVRGKKP